MTIRGLQSVKYLINQAVPLCSARSFSLGSSLVSPELTKDSIHALFDQRILAIRVPGFLDKKVCELVSKKLLTAGLIQEYTNAPGIGRVGISFYETTGNPEMEGKYFGEALKNLTIIRKVFSPYTNPIDSLRLQLDEIYPEGANLRVHNGRKMFTGLCRALESGQSIIPHEDKFERDESSDSSRVSVAENVQIALNVYLQNPKNGGELELYTQSLSTEEYDKLRGESYGIARDKLPPPALRIKPENGELVLFNSRNLHSVSAIDGDTRLSISSFISRKEDGSLIIWS